MTDSSTTEATNHGDDTSSELGAANGGSPVRAMSPIRWATVGVGVVIVALVMLFAVGRPGDDLAASPAIGQLVPPLKGATISNGSFDIDDHRGQWVVVNLFATWCVPCQVEHPELIAFDEEHTELGDAQLVSVVFGDRDDEVRAFFDERGGTWPVLGEEHGPIIVDFGATGVPETYLVAPNGIVVERILGGVTREDLNARIAAYS